MWFSQDIRTDDRIDFAFESFIYVIDVRTFFLMSSSFAPTEARALKAL